MSPVRAREQTDLVRCRGAHRQPSTVGGLAGPEQPGPGECWTAAPCAEVRGLGLSAPLAGISGPRYLPVVPSDPAAMLLGVQERSAHQIERLVRPAADEGAIG
jgi:hypothetical protein